MKILCDFSMSTVVYCFVGYCVAYGVSLRVGADKLVTKIVRQRSSPSQRIAVPVIA
jgi:hypothetical protein